MIVQLRLRRGTTAEWTTANPLLAAGEPALDTTANVLKIGDGTHNWNDLPIYANDPATISALVAAAETAQAAAEAAQVAAEAAQAASEAVGNSNDTIISGRINDSTSLTRAALGTVFVKPLTSTPPAASLVTKGLYARTAPAPTGQAAGVRIMVKDPSQNGVNGTGRIWGVGLGTSQIGYTDDDGATFQVKSGTFTDLVQGSDTVQGLYFSANYLWVLTTYALWRYAKPTANGNPGGIGTDATANLWNTTITAGSNGAALPQTTINIANGNYFATGGGTATVETSAGPQIVTYTGKTAGTLTGCSGGTGTMATSGKVRNGVRLFGLSDLVNGPAGSTGAGGTNASFRNSCFAISTDEANAYICEYGTLNATVTKTSLTDGHMAKNSNRLISDAGTFTADMIGKTVNVAGATSIAGTLVTTMTKVIQESGPAIAEVSGTAGTAVDATTISWPAQTYGSGVVIGGPSVYYSSNPTAAAGSVVWTKKKTFAQGKHCHAVKVIGGVPWVTIGDMSEQFTHCGIWTATAAAAGSWSQRAARPRGEVAKDPINFYPITVSGSSVVIGESDSSFRDGPLMFADQTGQVVRMIESTFRLPQPYSQTMRQLTIDSVTGNIYWYGTGEAGAVGPASGIWMARSPYTVPILLEDLGTSTDGETAPDGVLSNGYFWIGHYRCVVEKTLDQ